MSSGMVTIDFDGALSDCHYWRTNSLGDCSGRLSRRMPDGKIMCEKCLNRKRNPRKQIEELCLTFEALARPLIVELESSDLREQDYGLETDSMLAQMMQTAARLHDAFYQRSVLPSAPRRKRARSLVYKVRKLLGYAYP